MTKLEWHDFGLKKASKNSIRHPCLKAALLNRTPFDDKYLEFHSNLEFEQCSNNRILCK